MRLPEALELEDALLRDDGANQKRDERDDRHAAHCHALKLRDDSRRAQFRTAQQQPARAATTEPKKVTPFETSLPASTTASPISTSSG